MTAAGIRYASTVPPLPSGALAGAAPPMGAASAGTGANARARAIVVRLATAVLRPLVRRSLDKRATWGLLVLHGSRISAAAFQTAVDAKT